MVPIAIIAAGAFVAGAVYLTNKGGDTTPTDNGNTNELAEINLAPITDKDHLLGNPDADIVIVEYSDTECPFCKTFHRTMNQMMDEYGKDGKVAWVYRHFPLDGPHPKARTEAEATECAAELGGNTGYWDFLNKIFELTPSNNGLDLAILPNIAEEIGLDREAFTECLDSGRHEQTVEDQLQSGLTAGVRGTPHSIIVTKSSEDKVSFSGAYPYAVTRVVVDMLLAGKEPAIVQQFINLIRENASEAVIQNFLEQEFPESLN